MEWSVGHFVILDRILKSLTLLGRNQRNSLFGKLLRYIYKQLNFDDKNKNNFIVILYKSNNFILSCKMCFDRQILV